jgi:hypothetical protein
MKTNLFCLLIGVWPLLASAQNDQPVPSARAGEPSITVEGIRYESIRWGSRTPASITIHHKNGVVSIPLEKLPPSLQKRFNYDSIKAAEYRAAENEAEAKARAQGNAEVPMKENEAQIRLRAAKAAVETQHAAAKDPFISWPTREDDVIQKQANKVQEQAQKRANEAQAQAQKQANAAQARAISDEIRSLKFEIRALESELGSMPRVLSSADLGFAGLERAGAKKENLRRIIRAKSRLMESKRSQLSALQR